MRDSLGQMSIEVIFIFAISIMILIAFTIPISQLAIENNLDIVDSLNTKSAGLKIANGIDNIYSQGKGAKQVVVVEVSKDSTIIIKSKSLSTQIKLHDNKIKKFSFNHHADNINGNLKLNKGVNKILIRWPEDSEKIFFNKI